MKKKSNILIIVIVFILGMASMLLINKYIPNTQTIINKSEKEVTVTDTGIADAVEKLYDAVVVVGAYKNGTLSSSGTGFVYESDDKYAYILTNSHVVSNSSSIKVKFTNDKIENVELVGNDSYSDIAVLKIEKDKVIKIAQMGKSSELRLGDTVFAIGSPVSDEYSWTVTRGIVSGKDRLVTTSTSTYSNYEDYVMSVLQTDTSINSGNSGGPLANSNGEVIGITNMKLISDGIEGMGFAIPIDDALSYAKQIVSSGKVERPYLGVAMLDTTDTYNLRQYGVTIDSSLTGAVIVEAEDGSPASEAKLQKGDVITKIGENEVTSVSKLKYYLYKYAPGDKVTITYIRSGKTLTTEVKLDKAK